MKVIKCSDLERLHHAATTYKMNGQYSEAESAYRSLLLLEESLFGPDTSSVALNLYNLGGVLFAQYKNDEAKVVLRRAVEIWEKVHPTDYLSLLSYTEAVSLVNREYERAAHGFGERALVAA
jgi:tetratricopeptide (TPR) repeat protein